MMSSRELAPVPPRPHFNVPAVAQVDLVEAFLSGRKPTTLRAYDRDLADFAAFMSQPTAREAVSVLLASSHGDANAIALAYRTHLTERQLSAATIGRRLAALRSMVKLGKTLGMVSWTLEIRSPKSQPFRDTAGPGESGWKRILELVKSDAAAGDPIGVRNLALVRLLHDLGLRRGEVKALDLESLDLERGTLAILGKGRSETELLSLPGPVRKALAAWLDVRGRGPGPLLVRLDSGRPAGVLERLTADGIYFIIGTLGRRAGLSRAVRPHGLRHSAITTVLDRNGGDLRAAARFSRHRDIRTLAVYDDNRKDLAGQMADLISEE